MKKIAIPNAGTLSGCTIQMNGEPVPEIFNIISVFVDIETGKLPVACISILGGDLRTASLPDLSHPLLLPGTQLTVSLGWDGRSNDIFAGKIASQTLTIEEANATVILKAEGKKQSIPAKKPTTPVMIARLGENVISFSGKILAASQKGAAGPFSATIIVPGTELPAPGLFAQLEGFGKSFDGNRHVIGVSHTVEEGNWKTELRVS